MQIGELQQKLLDSEEDNKDKTRFDNIQTIGEAKLALSTLFKLVAKIRGKEIGLENKIVDLQNSNTVVIFTTCFIFFCANNVYTFQHENHIDELKAQVENIMQSHVHEKSSIEKECEEKVRVLLNQARGRQIESKF